MTWEIAVLLVVLGGAIVLFVTDKVRVDVVALLVLVTLALTGLVAPKEALSGFSNPAVVTVWAVFILSGGLARTGVASWVGRQVLRLAGSGELGLVTAGLGVMGIVRGDVFLLYGSRDKLKVLGSEPDFLVLTEEAQEPLRLQKAPLAGLLMAGVVLSVIVGWLPIYIAAVAGAGLMVLTGGLTMAEAYRAIEWRAVFLIANVLIMGPGGYRFLDYVKVGLPLTLVCLTVVLLVLPIFWPLTP